MSEFLRLLFNAHHSTTIILYTSIFIVSSILGFKCQRKEWYGTKRINKSVFYFLFLFLCVFYAFNDVAVDTPHYRAYFDHFVDLNSIDDGYGAVEKLYQLLNIFLHYFISDSYWGIAFIRVLQLSIFFHAIYLLRDKTIIGYAIMAYVAFFYFDSFNLLRSSLAGSLALLSFAYISDRRFFLSVGCGLLAMGIHTSGIFILATIGVYCICYETGLAKYNKLILVGATILFFLVIAVGGKYINRLLADDFGGGRYDYISASSGGIGVFILLKYFPPLVALYMLKKGRNNIVTGNWINLNFVWLIVGFAIALLAYQIGMLTRVAIYFSTPFLFLVPFYCILLYKNKSSNYKLVNLFLWIYFTFMYVNTMSGLYEISELGPFKFF